MTRQEYNKKYYAEHKEEMKENRRIWLENNPDWKSKYYEKNKENILEKNKKWQQENKKRFIELCQKSRRKRVEKLREEGCKNAWAVVANGATPKYKK